jgi:heme A synthase
VCHDLQNGGYQYATAAAAGVVYGDNGNMVYQKGPAEYGNVYPYPVSGYQLLCDPMCLSQQVAQLLSSLVSTVLRVRLLAHMAVSLSSSPFLLYSSTRLPVTRVTGPRPKDEAWSSCYGRHHA